MPELLTATDVARIAWDAIAALRAQQGYGDATRWIDGNATAKQAMIADVTSVLSEDGGSPLAAGFRHTAWKAAREAESPAWTYADAYELNAKKDPMIRTFANLEDRHKAEHHLFEAIVRGLRNAGMCPDLFP